MLAVALALDTLAIDPRAVAAYRRYIAGGGERDHAEARIAAIARRPSPLAKPDAVAREQGVIRYRAGVDLRLQGDYAGALAQLRRSYALLPHPLTIVQIGLVHQAAGDQVEARAAFERALAVAEWSQGKPATPRITPRHAGYIDVMAYSNDGLVLVTAGQDRQIILWDPLAGRLLRTLTSATPGPVRGLAFSADRGQLAATLEGGQILVWDVATAAEVRRIAPVEGATLVAMGPGFSTIAYCLADGTVGVWAADGKRLWSQPPPSSDCVNLVFSRDGSKLAQVTSEQVIVRASGSGSLLRSLPRSGAHVELADSVAFTPGGEALAVAHDRGISLLDLATGARTRDLAHGDFFAGSRFMFSADGSRLVLVDDDAAQLWNTATGRRVRRIGGPGVLVTSALLHPLARNIVTADSEGAIRIHDAATGDELHRLGHDTWGINDVSFHGDGTRLALASDDGSIKVWDTDTTKPLKQLRGHRGWVVFASINEAGDTLVSGSKDQTIRTWDLGNGRQKLKLDAMAFGKGNNAFASSADGNAVAYLARGYARSSQRYTKVWAIAIVDVRSGQEIFSLSPFRFARRGPGRELTVESPATTPSRKPTTIAMGPRGKLVAVAYTSTAPSRGVEEPTIVEVMAIASKQVQTSTAHSAPVSAMAFAPDGLLLATTTRASGEGIRLTRVADGELVASLAGHRDDFAVDLAFSPDGARLVSVGRDHEVKVWDVASGANLHTLTAHDAVVTGVAFTPDGRFFATSSKDRQVKIWEAATGKVVASLMPTRKGNWVVVASDGRVDGSPGGEELIYWEVGSIALPGFVAWDRQRRSGLLKTIMSLGR